MSASPRRWTGMGCMRLSTGDARDEERAIAVLHAALDGGVDFLDTADAYARDESEAGHNERLVARALARWSGDRTRIVVGTKGGIVRPEGAWRPDGRASHLVRACEASRRALGVPRIALYQLHAADPRTPFATSVRALAALKRDGLVESVGLCNVNVGQIERAREIVEIDAVQVELSPWQDANVRSGVVAYCLANGIRLLAYRPLGGARRASRVASEPALREIAAARGATPHEIALAWLRGLSPLVVPLPGPTRVETARSAGHAGSISLTAGERALLDERLPAGRAFHAPRERPSSAPRRADGEVLMLVGLPGAGKSTLARTLAADGYERLNRDEAGGSLAALLPDLDRLLAGGVSRVVLDNTYVTRKSRAPVLEVAGRHGLGVRCIHLATSLEEAQLNACERMVSRYGRLLSPEEIARTSRTDPGVFAPSAQFRARRELEPPDAAEGFSTIEVVPFERAAGSRGTGRAMLFWVDGVLGPPREDRAGDDVLARRGAVLRRLRDEGWTLLALAWRPEVAEGRAAAGAVEADLARLRERLGVEIEVEYCPHAAGPPVCWCRKPLPGLAALFVSRHGLDPARCVYVGTGAQDPGFARRIGFGYREADELFADPPFVAGP